MADPPTLVIFGVPLISKAAATDWGLVNWQFAATLGSLAGQTSRNFLILVAGTDEPETPVPAGIRYEFIKCPDLANGTVGTKRQDMEAKRIALASRSRHLGGGYLMFVDADDLVSSRLVEYVDKNPHKNGYLAATGYILHASTGDIAPSPMPGFRKPLDAICGTSSVVRLSPDELPDGSGKPAFFHQLFGKGHFLLRNQACESNRPLADFPFRAVVYVRGTGIHLSASSDNLALAIERYALLEDSIARNRIARGRELDAEFNLRAAEAMR